VEQAEADGGSLIETVRRAEGCFILKQHNPYTSSIRQTYPQEAAFMADDPLIGRPVIGMPNPELNRITPKQRAMLALAAGYVVLVLASLYSLIGIE
jgi:hypothetical protein